MARTTASATMTTCSADFCTTARDKPQSTSNDESDCRHDASSSADLDEVESE